MRQRRTTANKGSGEESKDSSAERCVANGGWAKNDVLDEVPDTGVGDSCKGFFVSDASVPGPWEVQETALVLFRRALGLLLIIDVGIRLHKQLEIFYSDDGICLGHVKEPRRPWDIFRPGVFYAHRLLPKAHVMWLEDLGLSWGLPAPPPPWHEPSLAVGSALGLWWPCFLMCLLGMCGVLLLLGFQSKRCMLLCWFLKNSLDERVPLLMVGGDDHLRSMFAFLCLLPATGPARPGRGALRSASIVTYGLLAQIGFIYFQTGLVKAQESIWTRPQLSALQFALHVEAVGRPLGRVIREHSGLCKLLTFLTVWFQIVGGALLVLCPLLGLPPRIGAWLRILLCWGFAFWQIGVALCLDIGLYQLISICALVPFLMSPPSQYRSQFLRSGVVPSLCRLGNWCRSRLAVVLTAYMVLGNVINIGVDTNILGFQPFSAEFKQFWVQIEYRVLFRGFRQEWQMMPRSINEMGAFHVVAGALDNGSFVEFKTPLSNLGNTRITNKWPLPFNRDGRVDLRLVRQLKRPCAGCNETHGTNEMRIGGYSNAFQMDNECVTNFPRYLCRKWNAMVGAEKIGKLLAVQIAYVWDWMTEDMKRIPPQLHPDEHLHMTCQHAEKKHKAVKLSPLARKVRGYGAAIFCVILSSWLLLFRCCCRHLYE